MKTTAQIDSLVLGDSEPIVRHLAPITAVTDFAYQQPPTATDQKAGSARPVQLPQLTTFRALSRQVFDAKAGREYIAEAVVFAWIMVVAAWPLSVTLNQLGTMMISPPNALW
jgi:hypothetical protein